MKSKFFLTSFLLVSVFLLDSCGGGGGGSAGNNPGESQGRNSILYSVANSAPAGDCQNGGITVYAGIDTNSNAVLDTVEITSTQYVCNGVDAASGMNGSNALVSMVNEATGTNCQYGGKKVNVGSDTNNNGVLDSSEITSSNYVCNGADGLNGSNGTNGTDGTNGADGYNSLISIVTEPTGTNCAYGGKKITSGMDTNRNNALDVSEVTSKEYVCNGDIVGGALFGQVTNSLLASPIAGASVRLSPGNLTAETDGSGNFSISVLPGSYTATITAQNFAGKSVQVTITQNATTQLSVALTSATDAVTQQWEVSAHANRTLALERATTEASTVSGVANCARCHAEQGFVAWLPQLLSGDSSNIRKPDGSAADLAYLQGLGLTQDQVQPITCKTCHNPEDNSLRLVGSTPMLPSGFSAGGVGKGAVCATCHNSRNQARGDEYPATSFGAPHASTSLDVLMGRNAYFMSSTVPRTPHAYIKDTCISCHMASGSDPAGPKDHSFRASYAGCVTCHTGIDGTNITVAVNAQLTSLAGAISDKAIAVMGNAPDELYVRAWNPATGLYSSLSSNDSNVFVNAPTSLTVLGMNGQMAFKITLLYGMTVGWSDGSSSENVTEIYTEIRSLKNSGTLVFSPDSTIPKAIWNYLLLTEDAAAAHNPVWTQGVVTNTINVLNAGN